MDQKKLKLAQPQDGGVGIISFGGGFRVIIAAAGEDGEPEVLGTFPTYEEAARFKKAWFQEMFDELEARGEIVKGADGRYRAT